MTNDEIAAAIIADVNKATSMRVLEYTVSTDNPHFENGLFIRCANEKDILLFVHLVGSRKISYSENTLEKLVELGALHNIRLKDVTYAH